MRYLILALLILGPTAKAQWTLGDCHHQVTALQAVKAMTAGQTIYACKQMTFKPTKTGIKIVGKK